MEAVGRLASGVAHDFNNLLTGISGYTDLLLMELPPEDPHRRDIEQIARAADRAAGLTGQLLAFSRRQITRPDVLDLNQILQELERMLKRLLGEDVEFATIPGENLGLIRADQGQLGQILMNLVVNSRDAMPQGGTLTIETANATLTARDLSGFPHLAPGSYVMLAVNDTGLGMTPQVRARIFEPFFTTKGVGQGTGLGLSTVYGIVQQNEGFVQVDSAPGAGTTIRIYFPQVPDAAVRNRHHVAGTAPRGGTETILVVEDEPDLRVLIRRILQRQGYSILEARHGRDALLQLRDHPGAVDLVLTDMVMPEMSGPDLIREALRVRASLRVLYMSGYIDAERVSRGLEQSALFVQKPFSAQQLAQRVREALDAPLPTAARSGASTPA
jgi:CheY-like chemotaxis protein